MIDRTRLADLGAWVAALACFVLFTGPVLLGWTSGIGATAAIAVLGLAQVVPLVGLRRWPIAAFVLTVAVPVLAALLGVRYTLWVSNSGAAVLIAAVVVAATQARRRSVPLAAAAALATIIATLIARPLYPNQDQDVVQLFAIAAGWFVGDLIGTQHRHRIELAVERDQAALEHDARIRTEERLRLSRDVHDVVSHSLSTIALRSGVARLLVDSEPEQTRAALTAIETTSRSALDELRTVLRRTGDVRDTTRLPGLDDISPLVDEVRALGLVIELRDEADPRGCPPSVQASAYRIVQESLTNVIKHSGATHASVHLVDDRDRLMITVRDDGQGGTIAGPGLGVAGMCERAELLGGEVSITSAPDGVTVTAELPRGGQR